MPVVDSKIWGPYTWYVIHQIAYSYIREKRVIPDREKRLLRSFMMNLRPILPCPSCRTHFGQTLSRYPITKENQNGSKIFNWTIRAHNLANKGLKKKVLTYAQAEAVHKKKIEHKKIIQFITTMLMESTNKPIANRKALAVCLTNLFPCIGCRPIISSYYRRSNPSKINTPKEMTLWAKRLIYACHRAMKECKC